MPVVFLYAERKITFSALNSFIPEITNFSSGPDPLWFTLQSFSYRVQHWLHSCSTNTQPQSATCRHGVMAVNRRLDVLQCCSCEFTSFCAAASSKELIKGNLLLLLFYYIQVDKHMVHPMNHFIGSFILIFCYPFIPFLVVFSFL